MPCWQRSFCSTAFDLCTNNCNAVRRHTRNHVNSNCSIMVTCRVNHSGPLSFSGSPSITVPPKYVGEERLDSRIWLANCSTSMRFPLDSAYNKNVIQGFARGRTQDLLLPRPTSRVSKLHFTPKGRAVVRHTSNKKTILPLFYLSVSPFPHLYFASCPCFSLSLSSLLPLSPSFVLPLSSRLHNLTKPPLDTITS